MENFTKLVRKAEEKECRLLMCFDLSEPGEEWGIKFYPEDDNDAHFYAYNRDLDVAARQLLDELKGFRQW